MTKIYTPDELLNGTVHAGRAHEFALIAYSVQQHPETSQSYARAAHDALIKYAAALGLVVMAKEEHDALVGMLEEVRDASPDVYSGKASDPQDDVEDMMDVQVLYDLQSDVEKLIGKKPSQVAA